MSRSQPGAALMDKERYIGLSGARHESFPRLSECLLRGIQASQKYQEEMKTVASISTALKIFMPTDPNKDDAYILLPVGVEAAWGLLQELGVSN